MKTRLVAHKLRASITQLGDSSNVRLCDWTAYLYVAPELTAKNWASICPLTVTISQARSEKHENGALTGMLRQGPALEERLHKLSQELRCLVCQNETLADSRADLAEDLRDEIREQMKAGKSDKEIIAFLTERYGQFILYRPQVTPTARSA